VGGVATGEVASGRDGVGRRRPLGSGLLGRQWPPNLEEGFEGGGGPVVVAGWLAEGEAARERRRPGGAGPPVGGAGGEKNAARRRLDNVG
jgi:hypothetical protein